MQPVADALAMATKRGEHQCERVFESVSRSIEPLLAPNNAFGRGTQVIHHDSPPEVLRVEI
jgi:hypothetical protein